MVQEEQGLDTKKDRSLVTTADYASQALISWCVMRIGYGRRVTAYSRRAARRLLHNAIGDSFSLVAEEDSASLRDGPAGAAMLARVTDAVNDALANRGGPALTSEDVLTAIDRGGSAGGRVGRHWVLDPVDGTLGFVRGDQYAVALALLDGGQVVAGVLGCPNMPTRADVLEAPDALTYGFSPRLVSKMLAGAKGAGAWYKGVLFCAARGAGAWASPSEPDVGAAPRRVTVSTQSEPSSARMCEPVLKANSSQGFTAAVASALGMASKPLRLYSMVKYGAVARGDADVFMKFPKAGYKEKIWDHAAGVIVVEEAGGIVTDAGGCGRRAPWVRHASCARETEVATSPPCAFLPAVGHQRAVGFRRRPLPGAPGPRHCGVFQRAARAFAERGRVVMGILSAVVLHPHATPCFVFVASLRWSAK